MGPAATPRTTSRAKVFYVSDDSDTFLDVDDEAEDDAGIYIFCLTVSSWSPTNYVSAWNFKKEKEKPQPRKKGK